MQDLELIDVLWRQDEDLGVGKEVYDANLRLELEKKQEMERIRLQEMVCPYEKALSLLLVLVLTYL